MTARRPTGTLLHPNGVVRTANQELATPNLLKMTFQTQVRVAHCQHFGVDRAVHPVAGGASFPHGFVFKHMRPALGRMTLETTIVLRPERRAAAFMRKTLVW